MPFMALDARFPAGIADFFGMAEEFTAICILMLET
jgi:hypothetical protein